MVMKCVNCGPEDHETPKRSFVEHRRRRRGLLWWAAMVARTIALGAAVVLGVLFLVFLYLVLVTNPSILIWLLGLGFLAIEFYRSIRDWVQNEGPADLWSWVKGE